MNRIQSVILWIAVFFTVPAQAYRIELSVASMPHTPVYLAGYYGDVVSVIDSARLDGNGKTVFERSRDLCAGIYTIVSPGKLTYDLFIDSGQQLNAVLDVETGTGRITGDLQTAAYAGYLAWQQKKQDRRQQAEQCRQLAGRYPGTFFSAYMNALRPAEPDSMPAGSGMEQMLKMYRYRRRHFFDRMDLSDVRLLRTPLYHETIHFYISKFVTQQTDTLIHIAYNMLERASGNYETFFYMSDFLIDFSLRSKIDHIYRLHNFVQRNRDMIGSKGMSLIPAGSRNNYFRLGGETLLRDRLQNMQLSGIDGHLFDHRQIKSKYRIFYFWKPGCPRCLADVAKWQAVLNKNKMKSCSGIAVNTESDVQRQTDRILAYDPLCINTSIRGKPECERLFYAGFYSKIIVTDTAGDIIGVFSSVAALDQFLGRI